MEKYFNNNTFVTKLAMGGEIKKENNSLTILVTVMGIIAFVAAIVYINKYSIASRNCKKQANEIDRLNFLVDS